MFTEAPKERSKVMPIVRPQPGRPTHCVLLSQSWAGVSTHYWNGKTIRCAGLKYCKACDPGLQSPRWQGYLVARSGASESIWILQITPGVVDDLLGRARAATGLHGMKCIFTRAGHRVNSPLAVRMVGWDDSVEQISMGYLQGHIRRLFGYAGPNESENGQKS